MLAITTDDAGFSCSILILALNQVIIPFALLDFRPDRKDRYTLSLMAALLPLLSVGIGAIYEALGWYPMFKAEYSSGVARLRGSLIPAYLSGFAMCGVFAALVLALDDRRPVYFGIVLADLIILLLAGGRAALAVTVFVVVAFILSSRQLRPRVRVWLTIWAAVVLPVLAILAPMFLTRFRMSGDNGREKMWAFLESLAADYPSQESGSATSSTQPRARSSSLWGRMRHITIICGSLSSWVMGECRSST